jgi:hypothetical protein
MTNIRIIKDICEVITNSLIIIIIIIIINGPKNLGNIKNININIYYNKIII